MKTPVVLFTFLILFAACTPDSNKKLEAIVLQNVSAGVDKRTVLSIDSVKIRRTKKFTMKTWLVRLLNNRSEGIGHFREQLLDDSVQLAYYSNTAAFQKESSIDVSPSTLKRIAYYTDALNKDKLMLAQLPKTIDSLKALLAGANNTDTTILFVDTQVYFTAVEGPDSAYCSYVMDNEYRLQDTSNRLNLWLAFKNGR